MVDQTIAILNAIRADASAEYAARIPEATRENITAVGNAILTHVPLTNEFTGTLINKIGKTIISSKMASNRLKPFKKGELPFGDTIEDIFVEIAAAEGAYDPEGTNPLGRRTPDVKVLYHSENRQDYYAASISTVQLKKAFLSGEGVDTLLGAIINSIYSGDEYDEYILTKQLLGDYEANYCDYGITAITDEATARAFLRSVRKASLDLTFVSTAYNKIGVKQVTPVEEQVLIILKDALAHVDVDVLAKTFNIGKTDFEPAIIPVDDFGTMEDTYALLVDKDFFFIYDTLITTDEQKNAQGLFTNHFYHHHQILSLSQFRNAVRFTTVDPTPEPPAGG